jgi:hypothetical protein
MAISKTPTKAMDNINISTGSHIYSFIQPCLKPVWNNPHKWEQNKKVMPQSIFT